MAANTDDKKKQDGFEVVDINTREIVHFVACTYDGSQREKIEMGLLRKTDTDRFFVRDTRIERKPS